MILKMFPSGESKECQGLPPPLGYNLIVQTPDSGIGLLREQ